MDFIIEKKKGRLLKKISITVLIIIIVLASFGAGMYFSQKDKVLENLAKEEVIYLGKLKGKYSEPEKDKLAQDINFDLFWKVWDTLKLEYVDRKELNDKEMFYGAIKGMVASLGDPYTVYLDPKLAKDFEEDLSGKFEGIGAEIGIRNEILTIISPLEDSPAYKAGLKAGDQIYYINGESTLGISINEAVKRIRGPKGEAVVLTIAREGADQLRDISITRDVIVIESVKKEIINDEDSGKKIYKIKITNFNGDTLDQFNQAISDVIKENPDGVIIDLRNNPGGYLDTSIEVASEWIEDGVIVSEQYSNSSTKDYGARGRARLKDYNTVLLVNQGSASASEIVAGALKYHNKATIVGQKTFGKGSVQALREFTDGSSVKITIAKWLTPDGVNINQDGIEPNIEVEMTIDDYENENDPQLDKAIEILTNN